MKYSRPEVTALVEDVLKRRRDAIGRYWFDLVTSVEAPRLDWSADVPTLRGFEILRSSGVTPMGRREPIGSGRRPLRVATWGSR